MMYKTELHCHSCLVSECARITPAEIVEKYVQAGYTTLVLTEHCSPATFHERNFHGEPDDWQGKVDYFLTSYHALRKEAAGKLNILLGAEFRLYNTETHSYGSSDFLGYGVSEEFLRSYPDLLHTSFKTFSRRVRDAGLRLYQAHPFRNDMVIVDPSLLDGVEVFNGSSSSGRRARNNFAELWAERFQLAGISGSDVHLVEHPPVGGICTEAPITDNETLLEVLRSGVYTLLHEEEQT